MSAATTFGLYCSLYVADGFSPLTATVCSADMNRESMLPLQISLPAENSGTLSTFVSLHFDSDVFTSDSLC